MTRLSDSSFPTFFNSFSSYLDFTIKFFNFQTQYGSSLFHSWSRAIQESIISNFQEENGKKFQDKFRYTFDSELKNMLKKTEFCKSLADFMDSYAELAPILNHDKSYRYFRSVMNNLDSMVEPFRDIVNRTPSEIIPMDGQFEIHHYKTSSPPKFRIPILVVGSLINRHYILDLFPETSIIRHFQQLGFDVYATDWRIPRVKDGNMTLESYAHKYLENAVDKVKEITGSGNVTLFGYCWGGILSLIYAALHPDNVQNLILHATPVDFGKTPTVLESWIKSIDIERFVQIFGNVPSSFLNISFLMRNPLEAMLKYPIYFSQPRNSKEIIQFMAVESWLYDSVPIIGKAFEQITNDIYKNNLLIQNKMMLGKDLVNLKKITMPVLNIFGTKDDLVSAESSRTITTTEGGISSKDKKTLEFPIGHVGLCISRTAHKKIWPEVGKWLIEHSM